jgi:transcriptional regulator with XRE-family HTH domain
MMETNRPVGDLLREWRQRRRMSQHDLACGAGIATALLSCVETGRAAASRDIVLQLSERLDIPLRERNRLLTAAGFAPVFHERRLDDPALLPARASIGAILAAYEPNPAVAIDRHWVVLAANPALGRVVAGVDPSLLRPPVNLLRLCLHPAGLAPRIANLRQWRAQVVSRLQRQIEISGDPALIDLSEEICDYPVPQAGQSDQAENEAVAVPLRLVTIDGRLAFFNTTTMFGHAVDITLAELRVESFLPADAQTAEIMRRLAQGSARGSRSVPPTTFG